MKKLLVKDKKRRLKIKTRELKYFILMSIIKNEIFFNLIRLNALVELKTKTIIATQSISNRCIYLINKTKFHKLAPFSRHFFLSLIRSGKIAGIRRGY